MRDLSAQAVIYEVATVIYMVRLGRGIFLSCPQPNPLTAWECQRGRGWQPPRGYFCLLRDPPDPLCPPGPGPKSHTWPTATPPWVIQNSPCWNCFELIGII